MLNPNVGPLASPVPPEPFEGSCPKTTGGMVAFEASVVVAGNDMVGLGASDDGGDPNRKVDIGMVGFDLSSWVIGVLVVKDGKLGRADGLAEVKVDRGWMGDGFSC